MNEKMEFKVITIGDSNVGKTSIIKRLVYNTFNDNTLVTTGMDFCKYNIKLEDGNEIVLRIVDTAGQERYKSLAKKYFTNANAALFVYAQDQEESFDNITNWISIFEENNRGNKMNIVKCLVGNKNDKEKKIDDTLVEKFVKDNKFFTFKSTSAKRGNKEILELFEELGDKLYQENKKYEKVKGVQVKLYQQKNNNKGCSVVDCIL